MPVQSSVIPMTLPVVIISPPLLDDTQREFRVAKGIKLLLRSLLHSQKQSETGGGWNNDALVEDNRDFRMILTLKLTVMARTTPG